MTPAPATTTAMMLLSRRLLQQPCGSNSSRSGSLHYCCLPPSSLPPSSSWRFVLSRRGTCNNNPRGVVRRGVKNDANAKSFTTLATNTSSRRIQPCTAVPALPKTVALPRTKSAGISGRSGGCGKSTRQLSSSKKKSGNSTTATAATGNTTTRQKATLAATATGGGGGTITTTPSPSPVPLMKHLREALSRFLREPRSLPVPRWITPRHYTFCFSECLGHASFIVVAISYAVDDYVYLRMIAVGGSTCMLFFTYFHPHGRVLWLPFKWNAAFIAINLYRLGKIYLDRYNAERLSPEILKLRNDNFYLMGPVSFSRLVRIARIEEYKKGEVFLRQGEPNPYIRVVLSGQCRVLFHGELTYTLEEANFVAESGLHAGLLLPGSVESSCSIVAETDRVRLLTWDRTELMALLKSDLGLRRALKATLSWDAIRKLKSQRTLMLDMPELQANPEAWTYRRNRQTLYRYQAILQNLLSHPRTLANCRKELNKYRLIHSISDALHERALEELGWTVEEFERGKKRREGSSSSSDTEDDDDNVDYAGGGTSDRRRREQQEEFLSLMQDRAQELFARMTR